MSLVVTLRCDGDSCTSTTSQHGSLPEVVSEARDLTWLSTRIAGETQWFCPLHQRYDVRLQRWVAARTMSRAVR